MMSVGHRQQRSAEFTRGSVLVAVRLPRAVQQNLRQACGVEDLTVSQVIRRALRHELKNMGYLQ